MHIRTKSAHGDVRPDQSHVLISIDRHICLQSIVHAAREGNNGRVRRKLKELAYIETRDFISGVSV